MVLFQFPFGAPATKDLRNVDTTTGTCRDFPEATDPPGGVVDPILNPLVVFPRIQQGVWHQYGNRKVHIKILNIVYITAAAPYVPAQDLYRIDFYNMQMIGNSIVAQGNSAQGTHCTNGILFSNTAVQYGMAGAPYEFDAWLEGPLLIADILPHNTERGDFCPLVTSSGLGHAHITLDVTLLE